MLEKNVAEGIAKTDVANSFWSLLDTLAELKIISEETNDASSHWYLFEKIFERHIHP